MDKLFICLANSHKPVSENAIGATGRCVAGIEISKYYNDGSIEVIQKIDQYGTRPQWIRPIDKSTETGAIPIETARKLKVYDIILLHDVELCDATGAHSENVFYKEIRIVGRFNGRNIQCLVDTLHKNFIFGNAQRTVSEKLFSEFDHSLMLVRVTNPEFYYETRSDGKNKLRAKFMYGGENVEYDDFPVTDPLFSDDDLTDINSKKERYMVFSLGLPYKGKHYKLITTVLP